MRTLLERAREVDGIRHQTYDYALVSDPSLRHVLAEFENSVGVLKNQDLRVSNLRLNNKIAQACSLRLYELQNYTKQLIRFQIITAEERRIYHGSGHAARFFSRDELRVMRAYIWVGETLKRRKRGMTVTPGEVVSLARESLGADLLGRLLKDPQEPVRKVKGGVLLTGPIVIGENHPVIGENHPVIGENHPVIGETPDDKKACILRKIPKLAQVDEESLRAYDRSALVALTERIEKISPTVEVDLKSVGIPTVVARAIMFISFANNHNLKRFESDENKALWASFQLALGTNTVTSYLLKEEKKGAKHLLHIFKAVAQAVKENPERYYSKGYQHA